MDGKKYAELRAKNKVQVLALGKHNFTIVKCCHDPDTGEEIAPEITNISREAIHKAVEYHQACLDGLKKLLADAGLGTDGV